MSTPEQRKAVARLGAFSMHARNDSRVTSAPGRKAFLESFEKKVDPEGKLSPAERTRRAEAARSAHFARMSLKRWHAKKSA